MRNPRFTKDANADAVQIDDVLVSTMELFPAGHKEYKLEIKPPEPGTVYAKKFKCPFCLGQFEKDVPRMSALRVTKIDYDLRVFYDKLEPVYFEIAACPACSFSAPASHFEKADTSNEDKLFNALAPYRGVFDFSGRHITDVNALFAGYYMAALCAPLSFTDALLLSARIWHRLYWLYYDCGDKEMAEITGKAAIEKYLKAYQEIDLTGEPMTRVKLILAELNYRYGSKKTASELFLQVRKDSAAGVQNQRLAEDRILALRN